MEIGTIGASDLESQIVFWVAILFAVSQVASRIAQKIPGKTGDEITSKVEKYLRYVVDFLAGRHGTPGDSGAIKPDEK